MENIRKEMSEVSYGFSWFKSSVKVLSKNNFRKKSDKASDGLYITVNPG